MREASNRRLYLELEAYRTLTALTDLVRAGDLNRDDIQGVLSFGLYAPDGKALYRYGEAPLQLEAMNSNTSPSSVQLDDDSIILHRMLGFDFPGRRPGGLLQMGRMRRDMSMPGEPVPAMAYLDYSLGDFAARRISLLVTLMLVSFTLVGLYISLIFMYRRYLNAADREATNRELVELGEAARTIVHEIKNPLSVIRIQCGLLKRGADKNISHGLSVIEDEVLRLTLMADRIRSYLSPNDRYSKSISIQGLLTGFSERYAATVIFQTSLSGDELVEVDENRLIEALDNIIANAREAMSGMDTVPEVVAYIKQQRVIIQVSDQGQGIPSEFRKKLFEPFFTTKPRGTGLGLALARKNIETSGGSLVYSERAGGGSVFTISLPVSRDENLRT